MGNAVNSFSLGFAVNGSYCFVYFFPMYFEDDLSTSDVIQAQAERIAALDLDTERCRTWLGDEEMLGDEARALRRLIATIETIRGLLAEQAAGTIRPNVFDAVVGTECSSALQDLEILHRWDGLLQVETTIVATE
jgi:hypothetical protein